MGRKSNPPTIIEQSAQLPEREHALVQRTASAAVSDATNWMRGAAAGGVMQAASYLGSVADRLLLETFENVKKTSTWNGIPCLGDGGESRRVATLDEYCRLFLGKSQRRIEELIRNRNLLGAEQYEQAEKLGFGQRDYNALKALPEVDQDLVRQALADGADKPAVVEKLVALTERVIAEKAQSNKERDDAKADADIVRENIAKADAKIRRAEYARDKAQRLWLEATPDEQEHKLVDEVDRTIRAVKEVLGLNAPDKEIGLRGAMLRLARHAEENRGDALPLLGEKIAELLTAVRILRDDPELMAPIRNDLGAEG